MNVINSRAGQSEDDSDITIINPSINENNAETINTMKEQTFAGATTNNQFCSMNYPSDFVFVHHDPLENAKKLEETLMNYIRDLKNESSSQLDCDKNLVTRLIDLIRPAYSNNEQKLAELNRIRDDIGVLHDKRFVQQKEKFEELQAEINRQNRMLFTASNDHSIYQDQMKSYSIFNSLPVTNSIDGYSQWTEIENDAKKLHEIIQTQKDQITEIVTLISQSITPTSSIQQVPVANNQPEKSNAKKQPTQVPPPPSSSAVKPDFLNTILSRLQAIGTQPNVSGQNRDKTESTNTTIITQHSPGSSPSESMNTLVMQTITDSINQPKPTDERPAEPKPTNEKPVEPKPTNEKPVEPKPTDEKPVEPEPINEPPTEHEPADETPIEPEPVNELPTEPEPVNELPTELEPIDETPVVPPPIVKPSVEPKPPNRQPVVIDVPERLINPVPIVPPSPDALRQCPVCNQDFSSACDDIEMYEHIDRCLFPAESFKAPEEFECPRCNKKYPVTQENVYLQHMNDCYNSQFE